MRIKSFAIALIGILSYRPQAHAGDTSGALLQCSGPLGIVISLDYSYLNIKDYNLRVRFPGLGGQPTLRQYWNNGNQLRFAIGVGGAGDTYFLEFSSQSSSVDHYGHSFFEGQLEISHSSDNNTQRTSMTCKEIDGGGTW